MPHAFRFAASIALIQAALIPALLIGLASAPSARAASDSGKPPGPVVYRPEAVPQDVRAYVSELKERAAREGIAASRLWRLLNHYRSGFVHDASTEIDGLAYFLSPSGPHDPAAELAASLDAFSEPPTDANEDSHAQCRYPARRRFLYDALKIERARLPWHPCPVLEAWKARLDAEAVSLVFASAYLNNAASMFGHTFFKFHSRSNRDDRDLLNYGVNFAAITADDGGAMFAVRGLFGGYRGFFSMLPYHQTLRQYVNLEGRDIWEYRLSLAPDELERLVEHLLEIQQTWFDYYFFTENCSYQLLAALEVARPALHLTDRLSYFVIPADTVRLIAREPGLVVKHAYRPSVETEFKLRASGMTSRERFETKRLVRAKDQDFEAELARFQSEEPAPESRARTLDAALLYSAIQSGSDARSLRPRDHRLKMARAALGLRSAPFDPALVDAHRPEEGHDSSFAALGYGRREGSNYQSVSVRAAYHALLSRDVGFLENTKLEAFRAQVRRYDQSSQTQLSEFTIVDLQAATPWTRFAKPLSWAANLGWARAPDRPYASTLPFSINGGVGAAAQPFGDRRLMLLALALADFDAADDLDLGYRVGASAQGQAIARLAPWWHLGFGAQYTWFVLGARSEFPVFWARQTLALSRNWEFSLEHRRAAEISENQAVVGWHFLF